MVAAMSSPAALNSRAEDLPADEESLAAGLVADQICALLNPGTVLGVGTGAGVLVRALVERGVDASAFDIPDPAIGTGANGPRRHLNVAPVGIAAGTWDLVVCSDVLQHMSVDDAENAIDRMCVPAAQVLVSADTEPAPETWAAAFAARGFFRRTDLDLTFVAPSAVLFERAELAPREIVERYEHFLQLLLTERRAPTAAALYEQVAELERVNREHERRLLTSRDHAIGAEAQIGRLRRELDRQRQLLVEQQAEFEELRAEYNDAKDAAAELGSAFEMACLERDLLGRYVADLRRSTSWRIGRFFVVPFAPLRPRNRRKRALAAKPRS